MKDRISQDDSRNASQVAASNAADGKDQTATFHIVGVGASAGGLEALETFFDQVPAECGMAFVVVQHLSPDFRSMMDELLARHTKMSVLRVEDGMRVEPNSVYLIPPKKEMIIQDGQLRLSDKDPSQGLSLPIDTFFRSLAQDAGDRSIGVVLSGSGSDGSRGVRAIHDVGGLVVAQSEETARFGSMPNAAIESGIVDLVLPPNEMAAALAKFVTVGMPGSGGSSEGAAPANGDAMNAIFKQLRLEYGIDFSWYKKSTVSRRIERRLQMLRSHDLNEYVERLSTDASELNQLYKDLLIGVTKFFRDAEAFNLLARDVLPTLLDNVPDGGEARLWVAGCGTGEEAYSLAMLVHEQLEKMSKPVEVKIFATDVHRASLDFARAATYGAESLSELSSARIDRYFVRQGKRYLVSAELRKLIVFAPHNVIKDAPFTKIDLISCRNMLIYLEPAAQKKVLSLFHFGLNRNGVLFLGSSESPADLADEFDTLDRHWKLYRKRRDARSRPELRLTLTSEFRHLRAGNSRPVRQPESSKAEQLLPAFETLVKDHAPPSFLIDERHQVLFAFPGASQFVQPRDGEPTNDLLQMVSPDLKVALAGAIQRCARQQKRVTFTGVPGAKLDDHQQVRLIVKPLDQGEYEQPRFLVTLDPMKAAALPPADHDSVALDEITRQRVEALETDLQHTRENLQATIEELEAANEELQATNEELVASNEELQSTNEELHSVNEELYTVNSEHQKKIEELTELNDDMDNLFRSTEVGTIFLDEKLCIRKFTPNAARNFQILPQDTGRRIDSFSHNLVYPELFHDIEQVAAGRVSNVQREVHDRHGTWYFLRILPYCSRKCSGGIVLSIIDISALKATQHELNVAYDALNSSLNGTVIADFNWEIQYANTAFSQMFGLDDPITLKGLRLSELFVSDNVKRLTEICTELDEDHAAALEYTIDRQDGSTLAVDVRTCTVSDGKGKARGRMISFIDITKRKSAEEQRESYAAELELANETLRNAECEARDAVEKRDRFLATLSHELRNPLAGLLNAVRVIEHAGASERQRTNAVESTKRQSRHMARLLNDLLDVARVTQGKVDFRKEVFDLREMVSDSLLAVQSLVNEKRQQLEVVVPEQPLMVEGDSARLLQVLENLLTNAARYTQEEGRIELQLASDNTEAVVTVRDNGRGIKPELLDDIFDMFVQSDESLDRRDGGMGVGLTLVRSLVKLHGGRVKAHSDGEGKGCEFTIRLPLTFRKRAVEQASPLAPVKNASQVGDDTGEDVYPTRIVLVEDNADARQMLQTLLELDGHQVCVAQDGKSGLESILRERPDVALVDIGLPELDGYEVARRTRKELYNGHVYLVALTGYGQQKDRTAVLDAGFDEHLVKPVNTDELNRVLKRPHKPR